MNEADARRRLEKARVARLATAGEDGVPHVVPLCFALEGDTLWWAVDEKPKRSRELRRLANIRANARVAVLADHYDEDWTALWWVRADGTARVVEEPGERERALAALGVKYPQYGLRRPEGPVVAVRIDRWRAWSAT